jgi:LCP family protein required for cell wall assembly
MSTPVADQPTWGGAGDEPAADARVHRPRPVADPSTGAAGAAHVTVDELLARSGAGVRRRRAERREATGRHERVDGYGDPVARPGPEGPPPARLATGSRPRPAASPRPAAAAAPAVRPSAPEFPVPGTAAASPAAEAPRWVPEVERPAVPPAPPRRVSAGDRPAVPPAAAPGPAAGGWATAVAASRPQTEAAPAAPPGAPAPVPEQPRRLTPIEQEWAGTGHPSLPLPDTGIRRSLPIPPIPGLDQGVPAGRAGTGGTGPQRTRTRVPARRRLPRPVLAVLTLLGVVLAYYVGLYFYVDRSIERVDALVTDGPEVLAPQLQDATQTYLVVGTGLPGRSGPASVSTLIAHLSADGKRAVLVTVPPTALTDTPACRAAGGAVRQPATEPFADALLDGGPSCLVRSVQQLTGLRVDHYLGLDLASLPGMVDALDGVSLCLPGGVSTDSSGLDLPAGGNDLSGRQVSGYLSPGRAGADVTGTTAAEREQLVLTSTLRSALSAGTLADPLTLTRFLGRAGSAFTVDADTTLGDVRALGATLGDLSGNAVERATVPVSRIGYVPAGSDQASTLIDATATRTLFRAVIDESRLPADEGTAGTSEADPADPPAAGSGPAGAPPADTGPDPASSDPVPAGTVVTVPPAGVTVDVLDATGAGRGGDVARSLAAAGFRTGAVGSEPAAVNQTLVRYGPQSLEPARTVAAAVPGAVLTESDAVDGAVQLVLGPGAASVTPVAVGSPVPAEAAPAAATEETAACG